MKKRFIVAAVILVAVGVVIFGSAFIASGFDFSKPDIAQCETNTYTLSDDFETIEIQTDEANITFKPSEDGKLRVDCVEQEKVKHEVSVENGALKIMAVDKRAWYDHLTLFSFTSQSTTVYLPSEHYQALTISTNTGDVSIPESFSFGDADITASTGDVDFNASSDGNLKINTGTGHIHIRGISAGALDLFVSTGHVDVRSVVCAGAVEIAVSTGKATLTDVSCQSVHSTGSTGDVTLNNVIAAASMAIRRSTGDVRLEQCDAGDLTVETSTGDVTGTLVSPKVFIAHSDTGEIDVPETTSGGKCKITTDTGDIILTIL